MSYTVFYNSTDGMIEMNAEQFVDMRQFKEIAAEIIQMIKREKCLRVLSDFQNAKFNLSIMEVYDVPQIVAGIGAETGVNAEDIRQAIVISERDREIFSFLETVSYNRNQTVRIFFNRAEARAWLLNIKTLPASPDTKQTF